MNVKANTAGFVPEVWAPELQENRTNNLVMLNLVSHQYESALLQKGDTVHIESMDEFATQDIDETVGLTVTAATVSEDTLVIDKYVGFAKAYQDVIKKQSAYELRQPIVERGGRALATAIDSYIMSKWTGIAVGNQPAAIAALTFESIVDAHALLDEKNVPEDDRFLIVNGRGRADLRKIPEFTAYKETGEAGLVKGRKGLVGEIYGTPVYVTNAVATSGGSYKFLLAHKSAFAVAVQIKPEIEYDRDIIKKADIITGSTLLGAKVLRDDHAVVISRTV
jgi:P22 coat protein - gene protein 5.